MVKPVKYGLGSTIRLLVFRVARFCKIQNILKKVVNELRQEICDENSWGEYRSMYPKNPDDIKKIELLRILIPERIIEAKIQR